MRLLVLVLIVLCWGAPCLQSKALAQSRIRTSITKPLAPSGVRADIPRPVFRGLRIGLPEDSARLVLKNIAPRTRTLSADTLLLLESDSAVIFGQPAYVQLQINHKKVRTIVINYHPLSGDRYLSVRDNMVHYLEQFYGRGIPTQNESLVHRRWETEDGTMEVSYTDKYTRVFVRLGKPQN